MAEDFLHYTPEPMNRYPLDLERSGVAIFGRLDTDTQEDVVDCVSRRLNAPRSDIKRALKGAEIPVWLVDPALLIGDEGRSVRTKDVETYSRLLSEDLKSMPPVVIDSGALEYPLCEGGHRTVGAIKAGLSRIYAIDIDGIEITTSGGIKFRE